MASDKEKERKLKKINTNLDNINAKMQDVFRSTYNTREDNKELLGRVSDDIYSIVDKIVAGNEDIQNVPNITRLYTRLDNKKEKQGLKVEEVKSIYELLSNEALTSSISTLPEVNRYLKLLDAQYDMICKYMPKLEIALEIKKDNVLSADSFNKKFINVLADQMNSEDQKIFVQRIDDLNLKYKIDELFDIMYDETAHYGEYFLWHVPYTKAIERLKNGRSTTLESTTLIESGKISMPGEDRLASALSEIAEEERPRDIKISFDTSYMLSDTIREYETLKKINRSNNNSLKEAFLRESADTDSKPRVETGIFDPSIDYGKEFDNIANEGLVPDTNRKKDVELDQIPGCVMKKLTHYNVYPIYIENVCVGYYYFEFSYIDNNDPTRNNIINSSTFPSHAPGADDRMQYENPVLRELARRIAEEIDNRFINANQDIKDEIYIMLKYNEQFGLGACNTNIKVTYLPPEDVYHFYFKLDPETHHGISDLQKCLIPALFWCLLDLSTTIGIVTRSQDKRIYYVKQNIETNVAKTLMNVINQIKKGNFGVRQMESMNNILNIVGRYNDMVIPQSPSGDSPIQFEIMQGQQIETPEALMNKWEESAINSTEVPIEVVNSSMQMDFAIKYTMSSSMFLRKIFKRQFICENHFSNIYTNVYNYEYNENEKLVKVMLPAPAFLTMTNSSQLLQNTKDYMTLIAETEYPNGSDEEKAEFIRLMLRHYLPTYIDVALIEQKKEEALINITVKNNSGNGEEE